jgi:hypothetical protein
MAMAGSPFQSERKRRGSSFHMERISDRSKCRDLSFTENNTEKDQRKSISVQAI